MSVYFLQSIMNCYKNFIVYRIIRVNSVRDRFNYRATHYMAMNGYYNFLNWFDDRAWYPLGRIVGGTVSGSVL